MKGRVSVTDLTKDPKINDSYYTKLYINKTTLADSGEYQCFVDDRSNEESQSLFVRIFGESFKLWKFPILNFQFEDWYDWIHLEIGEHYINLTEENSAYEINVKAPMEEAGWSIEVDAHPKATLLWYNNKNQVITNGPKYSISMEKNRANLKIHDVTIRDRGNYTLKATNEYEEKTLHLFLNVEGLFFVSQE